MITKTRLKQLSWAALIAVLVVAWVVSAQNAGDALERSFLNPPDGAKPRVWWHWMSGNITKEGIKLDLEWMNRVGIGGFQNFDGNLSTPQIVEKRLVYMTPEWKDAFQYATATADKLGLEMAIAASPGWTESGGPWVTPAQAMKKYVWSETRVEGGRPFTGTLRKPPTTTGTYQNIPRGRTGTESEPSKVEFYADSAVVAYRALDSDRPVSELQPKVTSSSGSFNLAALTDGDLVSFTQLPPAPVGEKAWIQFEFERPQTIRGITFVPGNAAGRDFGGGRGGGAGGNMELVASDDGQKFRTLLALPGGGNAGLPGGHRQVLPFHRAHSAAASRSGRTRPRRLRWPPRRIRRARWARRRWPGPVGARGDHRRGTGSIHLSAGKPLSGEGRLLGRLGPLQERHARCAGLLSRPQGGCDRFDFAHAFRRLSRLDAAHRPLGRASFWLHPDGHAKQPRLSRGYRPRSG